MPTARDRSRPQGHSPPVGVLGCTLLHGSSGWVPCDSPAFDRHRRIKREGPNHVSLPLHICGLSCSCRMGLWKTRNRCPVRNHRGLRKAERTTSTRYTSATAKSVQNTKRTGNPCSVRNIRKRSAQLIPLLQCARQSGRKSALPSRGLTIPSSEVALARVSIRVIVCGRIRIPPAGPTGRFWRVRERFAPLEPRLHRPP